MENCDILFTREICEREGVLTIVHASFLADEDAPRLMVTLQTFRGDGASCQSMLVHPDTARVLSKVLASVASEFDKRKPMSKEK